MSSLFTRETLELIVKVSEGFAIWLTFFVALSGVVYLFANRPLRRIEEVQQKLLENSVEQQRERAAKAEKDLLELQTKLAWRSFTPKQKRELVSELRRFAGTPVSLTLIGDMEANLFGQQVASVLREAGWILTTNFSGTISPPIYGVRCVYPPSDQAAETLIQLLRAHDVRAETAHGRGLEITVGLRPPP